MITLSRSILEDAARCKRKFLYKHVLNLKETGSNQSSSEGTIIHAGLAAVFNAVKDAQQLPGKVDFTGLSGDSVVGKQLKEIAMKAMAEMIVAGTYEYRGETQTLAEGMKEQECIERLGDVVNYYIDNQLAKDLHNAEIIAVEENFTMPIPLAPGSEQSDFALEGQIDLILRKTLDDGKQIIEVYDHKTVGEDVKKNLDYLRLDVQFLVYEWIVNEMQISAVAPFWNEVLPVEMVYNLIRRDRPPGYGTRELRYNQNGTVSKTNASQDPADYLRQKRMAHSPEELVYVESELFHLALNAVGLMNMATLDDMGMYTRTVIKTGSEACTNCPYFTKCAAELVGHGQPNFSFSTGG